MFYVLTEGDMVKRWPYTLADLQADNPQTSFPTNLTDTDLSHWNVFPCEPVEPPSFNPNTQGVERIYPEKVGDDWIERWVVVDLTPEQAEEVQNAQWETVRVERNSRLAACDWTQLIDSPLDNTQRNIWGDYRQELRDITQQSDPFNIVWPQEPQ